MKTLSEVKPRELLSNHIHIRLTDSDYNQIKARAEQVNLSMSDFMRRVSTPYWGRGEQLSVARPPGRVSGAPQALLRITGSSDTR